MKKTVILFFIFLASVAKADSGLPHKAEEANPSLCFYQNSNWDRVGRYHQWLLEQTNKDILFQHRRFVCRTLIIIVGNKKRKGLDLRKRENRIIKEKCDLSRIMILRRLEKLKEEEEEKEERRRRFHSDHFSNSSGSDEE